MTGLEKLGRAQRKNMRTWPVHNARMSLNALSVDRITDLPFFTTRDDALVRATSVRDPLGLLPVWSGIGRELVPHLASGVGNLDGVKAVLLIHWLTQDPLKELAARNFRACFRLLEGLLEFYLWAEPGKLHCYGARALGSPGGFQVNARDVSTAVNGLYQYYSGSCRRAGLLDSEWELASEVAAALKQCWSAAATQALKQDFERVLEDRRQSYRPKQALAASESLRAALRKVLASAALAKVLQGCLLGNPAQVALARHCAEIRGPKPPSPERFVAQLAQRLQDAADAASSLQPSLTRVADCEQFLVVLQQGFDLLRALDGHPLEDAAAFLEPQQAAHQAKAERFVTLFDVNAGERDGQLALLADRLAQKSPRTFLQELVGYHQRLLRERGAEPLISIEEGRIVSLIGENPTLPDVRKRLATGTPWINDYYLSTAGSIYGQLFQERA